MPLAPGVRLGPYEIGTQIGAGGMGEVYRATDTNLKRTVAIKVLPAVVATDGERLARFRREAEVLARLNHPNIAAIYGLESNGTAALVMELVEGPTLADRIAHGPIPVDDALPIAKQIAEAVEAAHDQGIIHRDLKPAHVKVREDGTVKVLDFGLAKALDPVAGGSTDATAAPTAAKIRAEADATLVAAKVPPLDQVRSLDLARSASREVLRSYPIAPVTFFGIAKKDLEFDGYSIRAGWKGAGAIWATLQDGTTFTDPTAYQVNRLGDDTVNALPKGAFVPLGGGPPDGHRCDGEALVQLLMPALFGWLIPTNAIR